jgi:uncharacterized protein YdeI (YjbR/CyaY-like superfamily)
LKQHHRSAQELWVGFHRKETGKPTPSWSESVDEALCFGWIDGVRKKLDATRYVQRFTPRKTNRWSALNIRKAKALIKEGRMQPAGLEAFEARDVKKSGYSIADRRTVKLDRTAEAAFRANKAAWTFLEAQLAGYRHLVADIVMSAKREETRARRLEMLIAISAAGRRLDPMRPLASQVHL